MGLRQEEQFVRDEAEGMERLVLISAMILSLFVWAYGVAMVKRINLPSFSYIVNLAILQVISAGVLRVGGGETRD